MTKHTQHNRDPSDLGREHLSGPWRSFDVLIPALNEAESLPYVLGPLIQIQRGGEPLNSGMTLRKILVLDNGSTDETAAIAKDFGVEVIFAPKRGYGSACLEGIKAIQDSPPDVVLFLDADGSDDLADLDPLLCLLSRSTDEPLSDQERFVLTSSLMEDHRYKNLEVSMVIGSRAKLAEQGALTSIQRFGNALSCFLLRRIFGAQFTDLGPFRAIRWPALEVLKMADQDFGWTVEMQAKACAHNMLCAERDVSYHPRRAGRSKVSGSLKGSFKAGIKILWVIGGAWWRGSSNSVT